MNVWLHVRMMERIHTIFFMLTVIRVMMEGSNPFTGHYKKSLQFHSRLTPSPPLLKIEFCNTNNLSAITPHLDTVVKNSKHFSTLAKPSISALARICQFWTFSIQSGAWGIEKFTLARPPPAQPEIS